MQLLPLWDRERYLAQLDQQLCRPRICAILLVYRLGGAVGEFSLLARWLAICRLCVFEYIGGDLLEKRSLVWGGACNYPGLAKDTLSLLST
jgi:hypothetical protein